MTERTLTVILTHEYTDFDALASLLGAALLYPGALPVLPRRLNRNVREFVHLYRGQLPFLNHPDLPKARVETAILVDTRSANWVRGMDNKSIGRIIDHHSHEESGELPAHWELTVDPVGANTTIFVEQIREQALPLTAVQATLLALGIYEDTGNLLYRSTTARDAGCVAWLLDEAQGANLEVMGRFLRHPLSQVQRQIYNQLAEQSEHLEIAGNQVVIAMASAPNFDEEISTLAHKLRNLFEPDALFLLVDLGDNVQMVARSTSDGVDVGAIARYLGGGGHSRAAAAHLRDQPIAQVRQQVEALVRQHSAPSVTVRAIMTLGRPQTLRVETPISRAVELMRRYGHEGFPVLRTRADGRDELAGMLVRREADRALNHGLGEQPVHRYMQAGGVTVTPEDSLTTLHQRMVESGWGQVPVVNSEGELMGIVTRTDLLKLWDQRENQSVQIADGQQRMQSLLPPLLHRLLHLVGEEARQRECMAYVVGGFVRDLMLGLDRQNHSGPDIDIVIEGDAIELAQSLQERFGGRVVSHRRFGTAKWLLNEADYPVQSQELSAGQNGQLPSHLDLITARTEFYTEPTVLPTVERSSIKLDLHRRDFTINTLALSLAPDRWGELLDFYNGLTDLRQGIVRVLHSISFVDDPTRILRAVRYEQRFDFAMESRTLELLRLAVDDGLLDRVTPARVRHELERILQESQPEKALARLDELGVLARLHPDLHMGPALRQRFAHLRHSLAQPDLPAAVVAEPVERLYWVLLTVDLSPETDPILAQRLGLQRSTEQLVTQVRALQAAAPSLATGNLPPSQVVAILDQASPAARWLFSLLQPDPTIQDSLQRYDQVWQQMLPELDGYALQEMGLRPGPLFKEILSQLRACRLDGTITSREAEIALVQQIIGRSQSKK